MRVLELRRADAIGADEGGDACERFGEAVRIAQAGVEETLLTDEWACGREPEIDGDDRGGRVQRLEMCVEGAEKNFRIGRRLGQAETARVAGVVFEAERELDLRGDVLRMRQLEREPVEKTP